MTSLKRRFRVKCRGGPYTCVLFMSGLWFVVWALTTHTRMIGQEAHVHTSASSSYSAGTAMIPISISSAQAAIPWMRVWLKKWKASVRLSKSLIELSFTCIRCPYSFPVCHSCEIYRCKKYSWLQLLCTYITHQNERWEIWCTLWPSNPSSYKWLGL